MIDFLLWLAKAICAGWLLVTLIIAIKVLRALRKHKALRRLYRIATCNHINMTQILAFDDSTELRICTGCGRVVSLTDEGTRRHNPHKLEEYERY